MHPKDHHHHPLPIAFGGKMALLSLLALLAFAAPLRAEPIRYIEDPAYQTLSPEEEHPMDELIRMAEENDVRAQFIVADLYYKGKGGLAKNRTKGRYWFERAAKQGYPHAFLRLAALSKRENKALESYRWYLIAERLAKSDKMRQFINHQMAELEVSAKMSRKDLKEAEAQAKAWQQQRIKEQKALEEELKKIAAAKAAAEAEKAKQEKAKTEKNETDAKSKTATEKEKEKDKDKDEQKDKDSKTKDNNPPSTVNGAFNG
jgi:hypothetical protein